MTNGLGAVLAIARKSRGMTQTELADVVGVTQPAINRYESGERDPDKKTLTKLAEVLGVTEELLTHGTRFRGALAVDAAHAAPEDDEGFDMAADGSAIESVARARVVFVRGNIDRQ